MPGAGTVEDLRRFQELDAAAREDIDDVWDASTRMFVDANLFKVSRMHEKIVLRIKSGVKFVCVDPRVGCVLYKRHVAGQRPPDATDGRGGVGKRRQDDVVMADHDASERRRDGHELPRATAPLTTWQCLAREARRVAITVHGRRACAESMLRDVPAVTLPDARWLTQNPTVFDVRRALRR